MLSSLSRPLEKYQVLRIQCSGAKHCNTIDVCEVLNSKSSSRYMLGMPMCVLKCVYGGNAFLIALTRALEVSV